MIPKPATLRRIARFLIFSVGLKALLFAAAYFLVASPQPASMALM